MADRGPENPEAARSSGRAGSLRVRAGIVVLVLVAAGAWMLWSAMRERAGESGSRAGKPVNVLLITLDTTRADYLRCYGRAAARTPNLDRIAQEGTRFTRCATSTSVTLPSHASIMTAVYPFVHGIRENATRRLADRSTTLAEKLQVEGYATQAILATTVLDRKYGLGQGFDDYREVPRSDKADSTISERKGDRVCDDAIDALRALAEQPFFLWVHFYDPHYPYALRRSESNEPSARYADEIEFMDTQIGRLMDELRSLGVERQTLVALVGDHGENLGQHGELYHGYFTYDTTVHVPLILRCPGVIPGGRSVKALVRTIDVAPTILDLVEAPPFEEPQGVSLKPLISGEAQELELAAYAEAMNGYLHFGLSPLRSLSVGGWKYILAPKPELYDLHTDPGEQHNLIDERPELATEMRAQLKALIADAPPPPTSDESAVLLDAADRASLESLGYAGGGRPVSENSTELDLFEPRGTDPKDVAPAIRLHDESRWAVSFRQFGRAEELLRRVIEAMPNAARPYADLAHALQAQGKIEESIQQYERALAVDPDHTYVRRLYSGLLIENRRWSQAIEQLRRVVREEPNDAASWYNLAIATASLGRLNEADDYMARALAITPEDVRIVHGAGVLRVQQNKLAEAAAYFRRALEIDPNHAKSRADLQRVLEMMED